MNNLLKIATAVAIGLLTMNCGCEDHPGRNEGHACSDNVVCTQNIVLVSVTVQTSQPLDDSYTVRVSTGEIIRPSQTYPSNTYVVLDDTYQRQLANQTDRFRFVGLRNGQEVVSQEYTISADCCHIEKVSGPEVVAATR